MTAHDEVQKLLQALPQDQQNFAKAVTVMRLENTTFRKQLADLKDAYDGLWKVLVVILDLAPDKTLRIHKTQFLRFKEEYRIDRTYDEETEEVVLRLLTVFDDPTSAPKTI